MDRIRRLVTEVIKLSKRMSLWGAGCIAAAIAISTGCSNTADQGSSVVEHTDQPSATPSAVTATIAAPASAVPTPSATAAPAAKSVSLIPEEVPEYSGSGSGYELDGVNVQADYSADQTLPLGVFLPETMIRFEQDGRTAWGTADKHNYITLIKLSSAKDVTGGKHEPGTDRGLLKFKEYEGSRVEGDRRVEAFIFTAHKDSFQAEIHIQDEQRDKLLPLFTSMLSGMEYMEKQPPIKPGVFFKVPDVGSSPGNKQALQETLDCIAAWAAKDKEKFAATMYSPLLKDNLQSFLLDNKNVYRFNKLTLVGIPIEGTKRAGFYVEFTQMTSEGYITESTYEISLLPNKQGEWKIANID
ncbi:MULTISPECIES: hypothetical protein [unclassified Paenibacillus]|uniref:hypothetical protein n=1 Tax=unclassified Paenibacillus TaxID=185978 RepID=UPI0003E1DB45|nr:MULTISPECIES: hypothetical protein [unclassified Paenibacillus]ETT48315.1 hypothetical protein C162_15640 [Paenibacillus sp. FSL R7-269]OMF93591.1 hypothetical protein BK147_17890 [Paenibacillus sp. FSL R7-0337]